jgi:hypothetical protein
MKGIKRRLFGDPSAPSFRGKHSFKNWPLRRRVYFWLKYDSGIFHVRDNERPPLLLLWIKIVLFPWWYYKARRDERKEREHLRSLY